MPILHIHSACPINRNREHPIVVGYRPICTLWAIKSIALYFGNNFAK